MLEKKSREPHFIPGLLDIFLCLLSILPQSEFSVDRWLDLALYNCLLRGGIEKCHRKPLYFLSSNHSVFYAFINTITQCLHIIGSTYQS